MLVLTRRLMEKVYIGKDICVTVVRLDGGQVRLGIEAPRTVPVLRAEVRRKDLGPKTAPATPIITTPDALPESDTPHP